MFLLLFFVLPVFSSVAPSNYEDYSKHFIYTLLDHIWIVEPSNLKEFRQIFTKKLSGFSIAGYFRQEA